MARRLSDLIKQNESKEKHEEEGKTNKSQSFEKFSIKNSQNDAKNSESPQKTPGDSPNSPFVSAGMQKSANSVNGKGFQKVEESSESTRKSENVVKIKGNSGHTLEIYYKISRFEFSAKHLENRNLAKIVEKPILHLEFKYKEKKIGECESDKCNDVIIQVSKATNRHITIAQIHDAIDALIEENARAYNFVDYVKEKYPDKWEEIIRDPYGWLLERTSKIVGNEKIKKYVAYALTSTQLELDEDELRFNFGLEGDSSEGKTRTIESVLSLVMKGETPFDSLAIIIEGVTKEAVTYLRNFDFSGRLVYVNQTDKQDLTRLLPILTEGRFSKLTTEQIEGVFNSEFIEVKGKPALVFSTVTDIIDSTKYQFINRTWRVYLPPDKDEMKARAIIRTKTFKLGYKPNDIDRLIFTAFLLTRPQKVTFNEDAEKFLEDYLIDLMHLTNDNKVAKRRLDLLLSFLKSKAGFEGIEQIDLNFIRNTFHSEFKFDILYNIVGLSEREYNVLKTVYNLMPREENVDMINCPKTAEIARAMDLDDETARNVLESLKRKHLVSRERINTAYHWKVMPVGERLVAFLEQTNSNDVIETDTGIAIKEFFRNDGRGNSKNAMLDQRTGRMRESNGEVDPIVERGKKEDGAYMKEYDISQANDDKRNNVNMKLTDICAKFDGREISDEEYANEKPVELWNCLHNAKAYIENSENGRRIYRFITN